MIGPAPPRRRWGRLAHVSAYGLSQILSQAGSVARGLILPNLLGPGGYGLVATINTVNRYAPYTSLGVHTYVLYEFPQLPEERRQAEIVDTIFTFTLLTAILSGIVCVVAGLWRFDTGQPEVVFGLLSLALNPLASGLWRVHQSLFQLNEHIAGIVRIQNAQAIFFFVAVIVLTYAAGIFGTFLAQFLSTVFLLVAVRLASPYRFRVRLKVDVLRRVLAYSIPVFFLYGVLDTTADSMNVFFIAQQLGIAQVGHYSIGVALGSLVFLWPKSIGVVFSTRVIAHAARDRTDGGADGRGMFLRLLMAHSLVFIAGLSIVYVFLPVAMRVVFPKYAEAIPAARLLLLAIFYQGIGSSAFLVLLGQKRFNRYLAVLAVIVAVLIPVVWSVTATGIVAVAAVAVGYRLANSHVMLTMTVADAFPRRWRFALYCAGLYLLGLVPVLLGWVIDLDALHVTRDNVLSFVPQLTLVLAALTGGFALMLYWLHRQTNVLRELSA